MVFADQDSNFRGVVQYDHSVGALRFHTEGSERMRIKSDGAVGIGTTNPTRQLELKGSSDNVPLVIDTAAGAHAGIWLKENGTDRWHVYSEASSGDLAFFNYSTSDESMRIEANGELNMKYDIVFGTAGKGICLGVTSNTDANTLDDYEEGTWTPVLGGSSGQSGQSYDSQVGHYRKVGNIVVASCYIILNTLGTVSGTYVSLSGLPFGSASNGCMYAASVARVEMFRISDGWGGPRFQLAAAGATYAYCLLYTSPSPRDLSTSRMPSSA